jgi:SEC-C motif-containing protein
VTPEVRCPCGTGLPYDGCCARHLGGTPAPTAETLMRSRYTAYATGHREHLVRTWHSSTRPRRLELDPALTWTGLVVLATSGGGLFDPEGEVEFVASYLAGGARQRLRERSRFVREDGLWRYLDGSVASGHG